MQVTTESELADDEPVVPPAPAPESVIARPQPRRFDLSAWQLQDLAFFGYIAVVVGLLIGFGVMRRGFADVWQLIAFHLALAILVAAILALAAYRPHPITRFLRWWYPLLLCTFCFEAVGHMVHLIVPQLIDAQLVHADRDLFGEMLTPLFQGDGSPVLTELMYIFYTSYYFMIPGIAFLFYFYRSDADGERPPQAFRQYMLAISLTYWVCYLHFLFTPAGGPIFWPRYPGPVHEMVGGPVTAIEQWVFNNGTIVGGSFPSSHVAVAAVCAWFAIRFSVAPAVIVPLCVGLAISTVYAGYHYGVDVLYGIVIGAIVTVIAARLFAWRERQRSLKLASGKEG